MISVSRIWAMTGFPCDKGPLKLAGSSRTAISSDTTGQTMNITTKDRGEPAAIPESPPQATRLGKGITSRLTKLEILQPRGGDTIPDQRGDTGSITDEEPLSFSPASTLIDRPAQ